MIKFVFTLEDEINSAEFTIEIDPSELEVDSTSSFEEVEDELIEVALDNLKDRLELKVPQEYVYHVMEKLK